MRLCFQDGGGHCVAVMSQSKSLMAHRTPNRPDGVCVRECVLQACHILHPQADAFSTDVSQTPRMHRPFGDDVGRKRVCIDPLI